MVIHPRYRSADRMGNVELREPSVYELVAVSWTVWKLEDWSWSTNSSDKSPRFHPSR